MSDKSKTPRSQPTKNHNATPHRTDIDGNRCVAFNPPTRTCREERRVPKFNIGNYFWGIKKKINRFPADLTYLSQRRAESRPLGEIDSVFNVIIYSYVVVGFQFFFFFLVNILTIRTWKPNGRTPFKFSEGWDSRKTRIYIFFYRTGPWCTYRWTIYPTSCWKWVVRPELTFNCYCTAVAVIAARMNDVIGIGTRALGTL
jgi:hypothetical protein